MARQVTLLTVFVSSPSDVAEERDALDGVLKELNRLWARSKHIQLNIIRWEFDVHPDLGTDPQSVINNQIGEYDIFLGILWHRFGTPTPRAGSGTEEEFLLAYERYISAPASMKIMFYFKDAPISPSKTDLDQLGKVRAFQKRLGGNAIYTSFNQSRDFVSLVRQHLTRVVEEWGRTWGAGVSAAITERVVARNEGEEEGEGEEEEEEGFLDLVEEATDRFEKLTKLSHRLSDAIEDLGEEIALRAEELQNSAQSRYKSILRHAAENMEIFSERLEVENQMFADLFQKAVSSYTRAAALVPELDPHDESGETIQALEQAATVLRVLRTTLSETVPSQQSLHESIKGTPRMSTRYNRGRRRSLKAIESFLEVLRSAIEQLDEAIATVDILLDTARK